MEHHISVDHMSEQNDGQKQSSEEREDRKLADLIKTTHSSLREKIQLAYAHNSRIKIEIEDSIWNEHADARMVNEIATLPSDPNTSSTPWCYSQAMKKLADCHWNINIDNDSNNSGGCSRTEWLKSHIEKYFESDQTRFCARLEKRKNYNKLGKTEPIVEEHKIDRFNVDDSFKTEVKILDVGSCHNPLKQEFLNKPVNITAIDLCPSAESVFKCDFLRVSIAKTDKLFAASNHNSNEIDQLEENGFDVVVFCLFLEYLPSPRLRHKACVRAKKLLKDNGLLLIVTPDSSRNHAKNETQMKSWRVAMANMGLLRIYTEKQRHLRCLGFVKVDESRFADICAEESSKLKLKLSQDSSNSNYSEMDEYDLLYIPQDNTTKELIKDKHPELENSINSRLIPPNTCKDS